MQKLTVITDPKVNDVFSDYPDTIVHKMEHLRHLVIKTAEQIESVTTLEETLKWGEPSFITNIGSTLRMDWKAKSPQQYAVYFQCSTKLVHTFKLVFGSLFKYEGNRAIVFNLNDNIPEAELTQCIKATLTYHKVKHLPNLGIND